MIPIKLAGTKIIIHTKTDQDTTYDSAPRSNAESSYNDYFVSYLVIWNQNNACVLANTMVTDDLDYCTTKSSPTMGLLPDT